MRIFFSGAQGTGKSTLVKQLGTILPTFTEMDSMSKLFLKDKTIQTDINTGGYIDFQRKILLYCLNNYVSLDNFYSSRSVIDSYAYLNYAWRHTTSNTVRGYVEDLLTMLDAYLDLCTGPDCIYFYIPVEFEINDSNPLRNNDPEYQKEIEELMNEAITHIKSKSNIRIVTLTGGVAERMSTICKTLTDFKVTV